MFMMEVVVWLLLIQDGKIFLLEKQREHGFEHRAIGGNVAAGESLKQALKREVMEEVGVEIDEQDLDLQYVIDRKLDATHHKLHLFFKVNRYKGAPYNKEAHIHQSGEWYHLDKLPEDIGPLVKRAIASLTSNKIYDEYGW